MELVAAERAADAVAEARQALAGPIDDPELAFRCYTALRRYSSDEHAIANALDRLERLATTPDQEAIWRARVHRWEGRLDEALAEIFRAVALRPDDIPLRRERAWIALARGYWGLDAQALIDAARVSASVPELRAGIGRADGLLLAFGGSLEAAAAEPAAFGHVRSPESVFRLVADRPRAGNASRKGVAMIAFSLAAGGAERILATSFRHIAQDPRFGWAKLYMVDLSPERARDFYLPLTGLSHADVTLLDRAGDVHEPLCWLPAAHARTAQAILDQLRRDKPAVVHAWLEPLTLFAGLAALIAGVPRIVLHTHNMHPEDLNPDDAFVPRMQECYRALLGRPEVSLVCCADAAARDYSAWIEPAQPSKILTLHNGFDASDIAHGGDASPLRAEMGIDPDALVVGTAFRFSPVKRPLQWVDAAAIVSAELPSCRFVMFGDGELRSATLDHIQAKGLADKFVLPGLATDLYRRLRILDLFVLSSRSEALPNVLLEAQSAGVPVIAYDVGGIRETMIPGTTGILVQDDTAEALASAMLTALRDAQWRKAAAVEGRKFVAHEFSVERMIANLRGILLTDGDRAQD
jgi:glycosyltransferase involved in cell wall biosynthesis